MGYGLRLATALMVMSSLAACDSKQINASILTIEGQPDQDIAAAPVSSDEPIVAQAPSSEYVPPLGEPCSDGDYAFRLWTCVNQRREYI